ncbi:hypothetical protein [Cupriavidus alkaliphilus]|uniref:hypothetical protein n=1 Tax=Cupriavidus alkaliphilus TaxID=942866 RepID=UPI00339D3AD8
MESLDLLQMAENAGGIREGRHSVRMRAPDLHHLATRIIRAAGAVRADVLPVPVERQPDGTFWHPALPPMKDEIFRLDWFAYANGMEAKCVAMNEADLTPAVLARYEADATAGDFSGWEPQRPAGKGWFCLAIYDTEDGPHAVFVRPLRAAVQTGSVDVAVTGSHLAAQAGCSAAAPQGASHV